mgnify:FL=1
MVSLLCVLSCNQEKDKPTNNTATIPVSKKKLNEKLVEANQRYVMRERDEINAFIKYRNWDMVETGTGLRYMKTKKGVGDRAESGMVAEIKYSIELLDGRVCYKTEEGETKKFLIDQDDVEKGLHEAIQYMNVGDIAIIILPSHLAHGLQGDENIIPSLASVIYYVELINLE